MRSSKLLTTTATTLACILGVAIASLPDEVCTTVHRGRKYPNTLWCIAEFWEHGSFSYDVCRPRSDVPPFGEINCKWRGQTIHVVTNEECDWKTVAGDTGQLKNKEIEFRVMKRCMSSRDNPYPPYSWDAGYGRELTA
ncbi:hypothetical protein PspLS_00747 [Pyricularia sp. CBS 133598]|nr:hypothetical protein PspLS_00747 [Pyricularia sp. CBS 133598]